MYRRFDPFKDNHIAYFDAGAGASEANELPKLPPPLERTPKDEAIGVIVALHRSLMPGKGEPQTSFLPIREVMRTFSPTMHVEQGDDGDPTRREENPDAYNPLIEAYAQDGLEALKARILVETDHYDKTELRKFIAFSQDGSQEASEGQMAENLKDDEVSAIVTNFVRFADEIYKDTSYKKQGFFKNWFRRNNKPADITNNGLLARNTALAEACGKGGLTALKAEYLAQVLPRQKNSNKEKAQSDIVKILKFHPQTETSDSTVSHPLPNNPPHAH